mgnify:CR=1 FL=1
MLVKIKTFLNGMREFRMDYTQNPGEHLLETYDSGRELAHKLTFRKWD